jgi:hypothetical protein
MTVPREAAERLDPPPAADLGSRAALGAAEEALCPPSTDVGRSTAPLPVVPGAPDHDRDKEGRP